MAHVLSIEVDARRCVGHGTCYTFFPELFTEDPQGRAVVRPAGAALAGGELADARNAVSTCPERAIAITSTPAG